MLTEKIRKITAAGALVGALAGALAGCFEEEKVRPTPTALPSGCKQTIDRWSKITVCQMDDRERWYRGNWLLAGSVIDYFNNGKAVVYKDDQAWEYSPSGITMTDEWGNSWKMERAEK